jgi:hypothetical protein
MRDVFFNGCLLQPNVYNFRKGKLVMAYRVKEGDSVTVHTYFLGLRVWTKSLSADQIGSESPDHTSSSKEPT